MLYVDKRISQLIWLYEYEKVYARIASIAHRGWAHALDLSRQLKRWGRKDHDRCQLGGSRRKGGRMQPPGGDCRPRPAEVTRRMVEAAGTAGRPARPSDDS